MELLYLWVGNYKDIFVEPGFNFSPRHRFAFEPEKNAEGEITGGTLTHEARNFPEDFFPKGVSNVTAIVGKNGSGKSTLVKLMTSLLGDKPLALLDHELTSSDYLLVQREAESSELKVKCLLYKTWCNASDEKDFPISHRESYFTKTRDKEPGQLFRDIGNVDRLGKQKLEFPMRPDFNKITQSNNLLVNSISTAFSLEELNKHSAYSRSISSNFMNKFEEYGNNKKVNTQVGTRFIEVKNIQILETLNNFKNIVKGNDSILDFLPNGLSLHFKRKSPSRKDNNYIVYNEKGNEEVVNIEGKVQPFVEGLITYVDEKLSKNPAYKNENISTKEVEEFLSIIIFDAIIYENIQNEFNSENGDNLIESTLIRVENFLKERPLSSVKEFARNRTGYLEGNGSFTLHFDLRDNKREKIIEISNIINFLHTSINDLYTLPFTISWPHELSFGEEKMIELYNLIILVFKEKENTPSILAIDEGSNGFHPEWQREYLKRVTHFLNVLTQEINVSKPHLILTSHSPFVLSDLPKECVIFLERNTEDDKKNGFKGIGRVVSDPTKTPQTFGANIHTLFTEGFFLDSLVGEFAKEKINGVIESINAIYARKRNLEGEELGEGDQEEIKKLRKFVAIIGEPILQAKLLEMLDEIDGKDLLQAEEERLKKRLKEIEAQRERNKSKDND